MGYVLWKREAVILLMIQSGDVIGGSESSKAPSGAGSSSSNISSGWLKIPISHSTWINAGQTAFHLPNTRPVSDFGRLLRMWSSCCTPNSSPGMVPNLFSKHWRRGWRRLESAKCSLLDSLYPQRQSLSGYDGSQCIRHLISLWRPHEDAGW